MWPDRLLCMDQFVGAVFFMELMELMVVWDYVWNNPFISKNSWLCYGNLCQIQVM